MTADLFKISIIDAALCIRAHRQIYPDCSVEDAVRQLRQSTASLASLDYERGVLLGDQIGWDSLRAGGTRDAQLRSVLFVMIAQLKPFWATAAAWGRTRLLAIASEDLMQCFRYAGLLGNPLSEEAANWWSEVITLARSLGEDLKTKNGRKGEILTIEYEKARLRSEGIDQQPQWIALDDDAAGYDVLSYVRNTMGEVTELRIEVKACSFSPLHFVLTRHEWDVAQAFARQYIVHVWNLETNTLRKFDTLEMAAHIPIDRGSGMWGEVRIQLM